MKIINSTNWRTEDLRKIFSEAKRRVNKIENRPINSIVTVRNGYNSDLSIWGRAYINSPHMTIIIGRIKKVINPKRNEKWKFAMEEITWTDEMKKKLAFVFTHEYYHNLGFRSQDRRNYKYDWTEQFNYEWAKNYPIRLKEEKPKVAVDVKAIRYQRAKSNLEKALTRFKRARTLLSKWQNKVKYYEKGLVFAKKGQ